MAKKPVNIDRIIDKFVKDRLIGEDDRLYAKTILVWAIEGEDGAKKISPEACRNLRKCGFISPDGKLYFNPDSDNSGLEFCLVVCGARGFIRYTPDKKYIDADKPSKTKGVKEVEK